MSSAHYALAPTSAPGAPASAMEPLKPAAPAPAASAAAAPPRDVATCAPEVRLGFLRKVFGILGAQLALTVAICAACMFVAPLRAAVLAGGGALSAVAMVATFGTLFALMLHKDSHPTNMRLLFAFTAAEAVLMGVVCARYAAAGLGYLVLEALVLTTAIFGGLTAYCFVSRRDFSFMGGALSAALFALIGASVVNLLFGVTGGQSPGLALLISWGGALLFSLYILYDVSMIMHHLSPDDYVLAAINLYLDFINLMLYILSILSRNRD